MPKYRPYRLWSILEFKRMILRQAETFGYSEQEKDELVSIIECDRWDFRKDYDGCTFVQDYLHPFLPCFRHDYNWYVRGGGLEYDKLFYNDLVRCGVRPSKARFYYFGVRAAWWTFYKWKHLIKGTKKTK